MRVSSEKCIIGILTSSKYSLVEYVSAVVETKRVAAELAVIVGNRPGKGLNGIECKTKAPVELLPYHSYEDSGTFEEDLIEVFDKHGVNLVVAIGYNTRFTELIVSRYKHRIINSYHALLPMFAAGFKSAQPRSAALKAGVRFTGCTIYFADVGATSGPIIMQAVVPVLQTDTDKILSERLIREEKKLYPGVIHLAATDRLVVEDQWVRILPEGLVYEPNR